MLTTGGPGSWQVALGLRNEDICIGGGQDAGGGGAVAQGYGHPAHYRLSESCNATASRRRGSAFVGPDVQVGALRISASGWEALVIQGLQVPPTPRCCH